MVDETRTPKTKTLGTIDATKAKKIPGWSEYHKHAKILADALKSSKEAKKNIRGHIAKTLGHDDTAIDFTVDEGGNVKVFEILEAKSGRQAGANLSDKF